MSRDASHHDALRFAALDLKENKQRSDGRNVPCLQRKQLKALTAEPPGSGARLIDGRRGRYNVARLMEQYGDMKLPDLRRVLANCPKAKSQSVHDRCRVRYGKDSR
jgi:hypothetical protein